MLSTNGCYLFEDNQIVVVNDRPNHGFQVAEPTMLRYSHPLLGEVLVMVSPSRYRSHNEEIRYYDSNGGLIRLEGKDQPYQAINAVLQANRIMAFRWFECTTRELEGMQPWVADILQKWGALQGAPHGISRGDLTEIEIEVHNYPTLDDGKIDFTATANVSIDQIPWYSKEFHAASYLSGWGAKNQVIAITEDGEEVDLILYFSPDRATFYGSPQMEFGDRDHRSGHPRRVARAARKLEVVSANA